MSTEPSELSELSKTPELATKFELAKIQALPKCELHIHLEGCITLPQIQALSVSTDSAPPRPFERLFTVTSLQDFLNTLDWICGLYKDGHSLQHLAQQFAAYAKQQQLQYVELIVNPSHWRTIHLDTLFGNLNEAFDREFQNGGPDVRMLPSLGRHQSAIDAKQLADWMIHCDLPRICGLSIDGSESVSGSNNERFAPAFHRVQAHGFKTTAHAGESSGAEGVIEALDILGVQRIDHGVRAAESPELLDRLAETQTALNVCVSSNCSLLYSNLSEHPLPALLAAGVPCTLNTDDPVILDITMNSELAELREAFGWTLDDLVKFQENAINAAFCEAETKTQLIQQLKEYQPLASGETS